ncbi:MAG: Clp protease N-terminal domain-containing protein [Dehalococcoidia bacterium]
MTTEAAALDYRDPEWVAQQLGIDKNAVYRYLDEGTLPGLRLGRKWLISESTLAEFLKRAEREQTERRISESRKRSRFDKFTERASRALELAREEALELGHDHVGTEHMLLGLLKVDDGVAARVLRNLGVASDDLRSQVESLIGRGDAPYSGDIALTPRAKKTLELAVKEARSLKHHYVGTEHILLGLMRAGEGIAFDLLTKQGLTPERVESEVKTLLSEARKER